MSSSTSLNLGSFCTSLVNFPTHCPHKSSSFLLHGAQFSPPSPNNNNNNSSTVFKHCSWKLTRPTKRAVAAVDSSDPAEKQETERKKYYFLVANAKFMLDEEEHFQEQMFERRRLYGERNKEPDFWLVIEPKFLDKFPNITKRLKRPAVALVSTNGPWITFMKLRLDRVLQESYEADSLEEALASTPVNLEFEKPETWTAPYPKYEYGWWESFLPPGSQTSKV
ncbi:putative histidine triad (hit) protein [Capsicum annuum]|uniref:Ycf54-like protein n=1 Tax=Capsicum annuum TaxID=4072 RepID=A0A2G2Y1F9_CAPAN|nr:ycf54-like protein [Capsicum annuum]KAF3682141.1 putative histidine triad (hit) protein [Capsicum annuum]PHT63572.1 hypothetical protein T459_32581 [Capsicum annuum]